MAKAVSYLEESEQKPKKMFNPMIIVGAVVVLVVLGGGFVLFKGSSNPQPTQMAADSNDAMEKEETKEPSDEKMTEGDEVPTADSSMMEGETKVISVEGGSFYFKPNEITVKKGEKVKIKLNSVSMQHDFVIDELNVKSALTPSGQSSEVEFIADKVGEFEYYCSVANHKAQGMVGKLIVTEQ